MKKSIQILMVGFFLVCFSTLGYSQKGNPPPDPAKESGPPPPPGLPIDAGLSYLIVAGIVYGIYEVKKKKELFF